MTSFKAEQELLIEIYKNTHCGMQSINNLLKDITDADLKDELSRMYENYDKISTKALLLAKERDLELKDLSIFKKAMLWSSVKMNTLKDDSKEHILEMLIQGSVVGSTSLMRAMQDFAEKDNVIHLLAEELLSIERQDEERLKLKLQALTTK